MAELANLHDFFRLVDEAYRDLRVVLIELDQIAPFPSLPAEWIPSSMN